MPVPASSVRSRPRPCVRLRSNDRFARTWIRPRGRATVPALGTAGGSPVVARHTWPVPGLAGRGRATPGRHVGGWREVCLCRLRPARVPGVRLGLRKADMRHMAEHGALARTGAGSCVRARPGCVRHLLRRWVARPGGLPRPAPAPAPAPAGHPDRPTLRPPARRPPGAPGSGRTRTSGHGSGSGEDMRSGYGGGGASDRYDRATVPRSSPSRGKRLPRRRRASAGVSGPCGEWRCRDPAFAGRTTTTGPPEGR